MARYETDTTLDRITSWEQFEELEAAGKPIPTMDIRAPRRTFPSQTVTSWEQVDKLLEAGDPLPLMDIEEGHHQEETIENIVGSNGEVFRTRGEYVRFEVNDLLRTAHENAVADRTTPPTRIPRRSKPQGLLAAIAGMDRSPVSMPEISAWNQIPFSDFDALEKAAYVLVEEGFLVVKPDQPGGERLVYGLAASSLDSGEVFERMVTEGARPKRTTEPRRKFFGKKT